MTQLERVHKPYPHQVSGIVAGGALEVEVSAAEVRAALADQLTPCHEALASMADEHGLDELALRGAAAALPPLERWAQELFPRVTVLRGCCSPRPAALEGALRLADLWS